MMFDRTYATPEGFELAKPLLMPDARSFGDVMEYLGEWDHKTMSARDGSCPTTAPKGRAMTRDSAAMAALESLAGLRSSGDPNIIGPFATIDARQIGGRSHRSIAVRATDAVMDTMAGRLVTEGDHLSFQLVAHERTNRVLVILSHGQIIGSFWLAYIDPDTIPAYPYARRDAVVSDLADRIKSATGWVPWRRELAGGAMEYGYDGWYPKGDATLRLQRRGEMPHTQPVVVARIDAGGNVTYLDGVAHLNALESDR